MNLLKKKVVQIPSAIILLFILYSTKCNRSFSFSKFANRGSIPILKSEKFKVRSTAFKVITTIGLLLLLIIFGIDGLAYDPAQAKESKLTAEKTKVEQQLAKEKEDQKIKEEQAKKDAEEREKTKGLAKFNLKEVTVSRVIDGDTIEISDGSKVRFIGVNTLESTTKTEPYGKEASDYTENQLTGKTVYLEKDVSETDKYGRLLRYIWLDIPKEISDSEIRANM